MVLVFLEKLFKRRFLLVVRAVFQLLFETLDVFAYDKLIHNRSPATRASPNPYTNVSRDCSRLSLVRRFATVARLRPFRQNGRHKSF